jgi:hypothetical protein
MPNLTVLLEGQNQSPRPSIGPSIRVVKIDFIETFSASDHPLRLDVCVHHLNSHVHSNSLCRLKSTYFRHNVLDIEP